MSMGYVQHATINAFPATPEEDCLLRFDSGYGITFEDAVHHVLIMGTTGSGKTADAVLPALLRLLLRGHCGLVVDIKGNLRAQVRVLACRCGREADIVEYGTGPGARPLNILKGMDRYAMYSFFESLTRQSFRDSSNNLDWHMKGVNVAADCGWLLCLLAALDPMFEPNIITISEMLSRPDEAVRLYQLFKARVYDRDNEEHALFVSSVEANRFHVLRERKEYGNRSEVESDEQLTWTLQGVRQALKSFLDAPGVSAHFAAPGAPGLDMVPILRDNKVALLRFGLDTGPIGASLSRVLLSRLYAAAYARGRDLPPGRKCFVAIDEFQEVADLSDGRFSDVSFISQAREFNGIFLASTQSMSALMLRGNSPAAVDAFVSNCNGRILFYSDDPLTNALAMRHDRSMELNTLEPGQAFVVQYAKSTRRHRFGIETFEQAFASTRDVLDALEDAAAPDTAEPVTERAGLRVLTGWAKTQLCAAGSEEQSRRFTVPERPWRKEANRENVAARLHEEAARPSGEPKAPGKERMVAKVQKKKGIAEKFPQFFAADAAVNISIPVGWADFAERAFSAFAATGLEVTLAGVGLDGTTLCAAEAESASWFHHHAESGATRFLNSLLRGSETICALCGEPVAGHDMEDATAQNGEDNDDDFGLSGHSRSDGLPLCRKCLHRYELDVTRPAQPVRG